MRGSGGLLAQAGDQGPSTPHNLDDDLRVLVALFHCDADGNRISCRSSKFDILQAIEFRLLRCPTGSMILVGRKLRVCPLTRMCVRVHQGERECACVSVTEGAYKNA